MIGPLHRESIGVWHINQTNDSWDAVIKKYDLEKFKFPVATKCLFNVYLNITSVFKGIHLWLVDSPYKFRKNSYAMLSSCSTLPCLTLNVRGPSYLGLSRSISWLLMPWLLTSPGHQQPWYWQYRIGTFLSYLRKDFNYLHPINVEIWHKM